MLSDCPIALEHGESHLEGRLLAPNEPGTPAPAVLVVHDAMGLSDFTVEKAGELAAMGYVALACDMYGHGVHCEDTAQAGEHLQPLLAEPERLRDRIVAWYEHLKSQPEVDASRVAAIGYCFGGQCVLELARSGADVQAVVSYHGLLTTHAPARPGEVHGRIAVYTGSRDPYAPGENVEALRQEMTDAGAAFQITEFSDAYHAFTNPSPPRGVDAGMQYDALADKLSWAGTCGLLDYVFAPDS